MRNRRDRGVEADRRAMTAGALPEKRIVVTGAAGLIGSAVVWALNRRGADNIVACDRLGADERWRNLAALRFRDYVDADELLARLEHGAFGPIDVVFHLGANSSTTETDVAGLMHNNFGFTRDLARWALGAGARFLYASSAATYGDGSAGMSDRDADLARLRPLNAYAYSKHLFDCHAARAGLLTRIVGLKYFNVFGPNETHKGDMRSVVHKACAQARATGRIALFKSHRPDCRDGEQCRDFLYVKDAAEMTLHLALAPGASGLYNLGSGEARTWIELARAVFDALGLEPRIDFIDMPEALRARYQYYTRADIGRLRESGYDKPVTPLADAVADCVRNYIVPGRTLDERDPA